MIGIQMDESLIKKVMSYMSNVQCDNCSAHGVYNCLGDGNERFACAYELLMSDSNNKVAVAEPEIEPVETK